MRGRACYRADMAEIVNLNKARKARARDAAKASADANRAKFGRTKRERAADVAEQRRIDRELDGARRD